MHKDPDSDIYRLVGASVCFPTRWNLAEKMGLSLAAIHAPTPGYRERLDSTMNRYFVRMRKPVWRLNWGLVDDPTLFQTLRRLARSQDIVFTIRIYVKPLNHLNAYPQRAAAMARALRGMPDWWRLYKSLPAFHDAVLGWLDRVGRTDGGQEGVRSANAGTGGAA